MKTYTDNEKLIVPKYSTNSYDDIEEKNLIVIRVCTTISQTPAILTQELVQRLGTILNSKPTTDVFLRLCKVKADTRYVLSKELSLPRRSTYTALENLRGMGLLVEARPTIGIGKPGRKPTIFALPTYRSDDIAEAVERYRYARTSAYEEVKRITQLLLDDYYEIITRHRPHEKQAYQQEIVPIIKKECKEVRWFDIFNKVESELKKVGITVVH